VSDDPATVSVIIPNDRNPVADCLAAIRAQTHQPIETIVVETSTAARNQAVARSSGEILFFVNADISLAPDALATAVRLLRERPDYGCVQGIPSPRPASYRALRGHYWRSRNAGQVTTISFELAAIPRAVFNEIGPLDESLAECEDIEYSGRLAPRHPILLTELVTGQYNAKAGLGTLLRQQFRRSQLLIPATAANRQPSPPTTESPSCQTSHPQADGLSTDFRQLPHSGLDKGRLKKGRSPLSRAGVCPAVGEFARPQFGDVGGVSSQVGDVVGADRQVDGVAGAGWHVGDVAGGGRPVDDAGTRSPANGAAGTWSSVGGAAGGGPRVDEGAGSRFGEVVGTGRRVGAGAGVRLRGVPGFKWRRFGWGRLSPVAGVLAAGLAVLTAPLGLVALPFVVVPLACLLLFVVANRGLFRFVRGEGGGVRFVVAHFLVCLVVMGGAVWGTLRWLVDPKFGPSRVVGPEPAAPVVPVRPVNRRRQTLITLVFAVGILAALWLAFRDQDWRLAGRLVRPDALPYLLLSCLANLAGLTLAMVAWRCLLVDTAGRVGYVVAARIYFVGVLTQKLPGRVWGLLTHIRLGRAAGFSATRMVTVYALNLPVVLMTAAAVGSTVAPSVLGGRAFLLVIPLLLTIGMYARPQAINLFVGRLLLLVGRVLPGGAAPTRAMRFSIVVSIASWLVSGLHLWVLAILLGASPLPALPACVGGFALAMLVSSLAVFLPDGWGAREVAMVIPLATVLPLPVAGIVAVASRLVTFASELAGAALAVVLARFVERRGVDVPVTMPGRQDSHV
jgi:glycosyltransferase 2 family protein